MCIHSVATVAMMNKYIKIIIKYVTRTKRFSISKWKSGYVDTYTHNHVNKITG